MKKMLGTLLACSLLLSGSAVYAGQSTATLASPTYTALHNQVPGHYTDLQGHPAREAVETLTRMGILTRTGNTAFHPDRALTKEEVKSWYAKAFGAYSTTQWQPDETVTRLETALWLKGILPPSNRGINGGNYVNPYSDLGQLTAEQKEAVLLMYNLGIMLPVDYEESKDRQKGKGKGHGNGKKIGILLGKGHAYGLDKQKRKHKQKHDREEQQTALFAPNQTVTRGEGAIILLKALEHSLSTAKPVTYQTVTQLPETVYTLAQENKYARGVSTVREGGNLYILITGGEVPTSGYSVRLDDIRETDAGLFLQAGLTTPDPNHMHAQVISYPYLVIQVQDTGKPVYLR